MIRIGILGVAHMHVWSYVSGMQKHEDAELVGCWDENQDRLADFATRAHVTRITGAEELLERVDAVVICSENTRHADLAALAARHGKHILCEKPLVTSEEEAAIIEGAARQVKVMTAFPCRYSPAFARLRERVHAGDIGKLLAVNATNRGRCPFDWFVNKELSGGGAMIDHTVHVADLLRVLVGEDPVRVQAQIGSNMYGQDWDDTAMLTLDFPGGVFATLDSSWSRPKSFKTWGDVTMAVIGDAGVIELDMFGQEVDRYGSGDPSHTVSGYGSNLDALLIDDFISCLRDDLPTPISAHDGIQAARVAIAGYRSASAGQPVALVA